MTKAHWDASRPARRCFIRRLGLAAGAVALAALPACRGDDGKPRDQNTAATSGTTATPAPARGGTLTLAPTNDLQTLDPLAYNTVQSGLAIRSMTDTLVRFSRDLRVLPGLARTWEIADGGTRYIFHLQPDVAFQDGTPLTAEAVRFNLNRFIADRTSPWHPDVNDVTAVTAADPLTLTITLANPSAPFLSKLPLGSGIVISPAAVERLGDRLFADFTGAGTGPWSFERWRRDDEFTAMRNPQYWDRDAAGGQLPYLDRLRFVPTPNEATRLIKLQTGDVDALASYAGLPPPAETAVLKRDPGIVYEEEPGLNFQGLMLNATRPPFDRREVRQALAHAIDRTDIVRTVLYGGGVPSDTIIPPSQIGHDPTYRPYLAPDINRARSLLTQAGRQPARFTCLLGAGSNFNQQILELIQAQIAPAGFDMQIETLAPAAVRDRVVKGEYLAMLHGWSGFVDPDGNTYQLFHSTSSLNTSRYTSPTLDALLDQGRRTLDEPARTPIYQQINRLLAEEAPYVVLYHGLNSTAVRHTVRNMPLGTASTIRFAAVWKSP